MCRYRFQMCQQTDLDGKINPGMYALAAARAYIPYSLALK